MYICVSLECLHERYVGLQIIVVYKVHCTWSTVEPMPLVERVPHSCILPFHLPLCTLTTYLVYTQNTDVLPTFMYQSASSQQSVSPWFPPIQDVAMCTTFVTFHFLLSLILSTFLWSSYLLFAVEYSIVMYACTLCMYGTQDLSFQRSVPWWRWHHWQRTGAMQVWCFAW